MIWLILFILLGIFILVMTEWRERKKSADATLSSASATVVEQQPDPNCCGQHLVCEKDNMLKAMEKPIYFDDEELDALANTAVEDMTDEQSDAIREVFHTLKDRDVIDWVRSMQIRSIALPDDVREEALLIVREQRQQLSTDKH